MLLPAATTKKHRLFASLSDRRWVPFGDWWCSVVLAGSVWATKPRGRGFWLTVALSSVHLAEAGGGVLRRLRSSAFTVCRSLVIMFAMAAANACLLLTLTGTWQRLAANSLMATVCSPYNGRLRIARWLTTRYIVSLKLLSNVDEAYSFIVVDNGLRHLLARWAA